MSEGAGVPGMVRKQALGRISPVLWEIPVSFRDDMRVPVRVYADEKLLEAALDDRSIEQAVNASTLPGLVGQVLVMPDVHQGYGFPIGGVGGTVPPTLKELDRVCRLGWEWALKNGYAQAEDLPRTEEGGRIQGADPATVSSRAKERGRPQLGTLGAGNPFIEVDLVEKIYHPEAASVLGLTEGGLALQIHCGSRGSGHQVCSDYVREFQGAVQRYAIRLPDRELVCAPLNSPEGKRYFAAMACAANYAFAKRQILAHHARKSFEQVFAGRLKGWQLRQVYDIAHNMGKIEEHTIQGEKGKVLVHRKGATR